mmetsp:Transcript_6603/g.16199  ORF Transcript_6603/g.16199 Transcript_6603/m.16199 type:complete len:470 (+) Transcript_6603:73-1482(+)
MWTTVTSFAESAASYALPLLVLSVSVLVVSMLVREACRSLSFWAPPRAGAALTGWVTIPQNESWYVVQSDGKIRTLEGPCTVWLLHARLTQLKLVVASESEYVKVQYISGRTEVVRGPAAVRQDPSQHESLVRHSAVALADSEIIVVYRKDDSPEAVGEDAYKRCVVRGPCLYSPRDASEYIHDFSWHGHDPSGDSAGVCRKRPNALRFQKLRNTPMSLYFDVENVRTNDDALLTVRLMIFYRIFDIEVMLDATNDPVAEVINAISSDVIEFAASGTFETFKESAEQLSQLAQYRNLLDRAKAIGLLVSKVVFRGYVAPRRLQQMHDDAIERRTKLVLERETEEQEQQQVDERLAREDERAHVQRKMARTQAEHDALLAREDFEARQREARVEAERILAEKQAQTKAEHEHLKSLRTELGLSPEQIGALLLAQANGVPERLIQIQAPHSAANASTGPALALHLTPDADN